VLVVRCPYYTYSPKRKKKKKKREKKERKKRGQVEGERKNEMGIKREK